MKNKKTIFYNNESLSSVMLEGLSFVLTLAVSLIMIFAIFTIIETSYKPNANLLYHTEKN